MPPGTETSEIHILLQAHMKRCDHKNSKLRLVVKGKGCVNRLHEEKSKSTDFA